MGSMAGCFVLVTAIAGAGELVISSFAGNGKMTWSCPTNGVSEYRIEWCSDLSAGWWSDLYGGQNLVVPTGTVMTASVPMFYRIKALGAAPTNMVYIPAGSFSMGDNFSLGYAAEIPVHAVHVSAFYMDKTEVTWAKWKEVRGWSTANSYTYDNTGAGKADDNPVQTVSWYDCVKWCNARSQKEGKPFVYFTDAALTQAYKSGQVAPYVNWSAAGYRLPTEAEWERAARGGLSGKRFPWGDTIDHAKANYYGSPLFYAYDLGYAGNDTLYATGSYYTSPVGSFAPNGYGLYDMAGNVWEWCWDWYGSTYYGTSPSSNPRGPASGSYRVERGGSSDARGGTYCRVAYRSSTYNQVPTKSSAEFGFRAVLPLGL